MVIKAKRPNGNLDAHYDSVYLVYPIERIYATLSRKLHGEDHVEKHSTPSRIFQVKSWYKPDNSILQTLSGILRSISPFLRGGENRI